MTRILVALLAVLCLLMVGLHATAAPRSSDVSALLPRAKKPEKKRLPTIKGTIKEDTRWHLEPEKVRGRPPMPSVFFVIPRADPFPEKPNK